MADATTNHAQPDRAVDAPSNMVAGKADAVAVGMSEPAAHTARSAFIANVDPPLSSNQQQSVLEADSQLLPDGTQDHDRDPRRQHESDDQHAVLVQSEDSQPAGEPADEEDTMDFKPIPVSRTSRSAVLAEDTADANHEKDETLPLQPQADELVVKRQNDSAATPLAAEGSPTHGGAGSSERLAPSHEEKTEARSPAEHDTSTNTRADITRAAYIPTGHLETQPARRPRHLRPTVSAKPCVGDSFTAVASSEAEASHMPQAQERPPARSHDDEVAPDSEPSPPSEPNDIKHQDEASILSPATVISPKVTEQETHGGAAQPARPKSVDPAVEDDRHSRQAETTAHRRPVKQQSSKDSSAPVDDGSRASAARRIQPRPTKASQLRKQFKDATMTPKYLNRPQGFHISQVRASSPSPLTSAATPPAVLKRVKSKLKQQGRQHEKLPQQLGDTSNQRLPATATQSAQPAKSKQPAASTTHKANSVPDSKGAIRQRSPAKKDSVLTLSSADTRAAAPSTPRSRATVPRAESRPEAKHTPHQRKTKKKPLHKTDNAGKQKSRKQVSSSPSKHGPVPGNTVGRSRGSVSSSDRSASASPERNVARSPTRHRQTKQHASKATTVRKTGEKPATRSTMLQSETIAAPLTDKISLDSPTKVSDEPPVAVSDTSAPPKHIPAEIEPRSAGASASSSHAAVPLRPQTLTDQDGNKSESLDVTCHTDATSNSATIPSELEGAEADVFGIDVPTASAECAQYRDFSSTRAFVHVSGPDTVESTAVQVVSSAEVRPTHAGAKVTTVLPAHHGPSGDGNETSSDNGETQAHTTSLLPTTMVMLNEVELWKGMNEAVKTISQPVHIKEIPKSSMKLFVVATGYAGSSRYAIRRALNRIGASEAPFRCNVDCGVYWCSGSFQSVIKLGFTDGWVPRVPGLFALAKKVPLARVLHRMQKLHASHFDFCPRTWRVPADFSAFKAACEASKNAQAFYIVKPDAGAQGSGIFITQTPSDVRFRRLKGDAVIQDYLARPLLVEGMKFDLRLYAVIVSVSPLRVLLARQGMARFCTQEYTPPSVDNIENSFMHLTNYSLNKKSENFVHNDGRGEADDADDCIDDAGDEEDDSGGSKRPLSALWATLKAKGLDTAAIWRSIKRIVAQTMVALMPNLAVEQSRATQIRPKVRSFQIVGFDVLIDQDLNAHIIEINANPSLNILHDQLTDQGRLVVPSPTDEVIKIPVLTDTFGLIAQANYHMQARQLARFKASLALDFGHCGSTDEADSSFSNAVNSPAPTSPRRRAGGVNSIQRVTSSSQSVLIQAAEDALGNSKSPRRKGAPPLSPTSMERLRLLQRRQQYSARLRNRRAGKQHGQLSSPHKIDQAAAESPPKQPGKPPHVPDSWDDPFEALIEYHVEAHRDDDIIACWQELNCGDLDDLTEYVMTDCRHTLGTNLAVLYIFRHFVPFSRRDTPLLDNATFRSVVRACDKPKHVSMTNADVDFIYLDVARQHMLPRAGLTFDAFFDALLAVTVKLWSKLDPPHAFRTALSPVVSKVLHKLLLKQRKARQQHQHTSV